MRLRTFTSVISLLMTFQAAHSQLTSCSGSTWWTPLNNPDGTNPCAIATDMRKQCANGGTSLDTSNGAMSHPPSPCFCSPDAYEIHGACAACQAPSQSDAQSMTANFPSYNTWLNGTNCTVFNTTVSLPLWIPNAPSSNLSFNISQVMDEANTLLAANSGANAQSSSTTAAGGGPVGATAAPPAPSKSSSKSSNKAGPIVGGLIGGILLLALLAAAFVLWRRRQRGRAAPSSEFTKYIRQPVLHRSSLKPESVRTQVGVLPESGPPDTMPLTAIEDNEAPPAFTPGHYAGPVFEKDGYRAEVSAPAYASPSTVVPQSSRSHDTHPADASGPLF